MPWRNGARVAWTAALLLAAPGAAQDMHGDAPPAPETLQVAQAARSPLSERIAAAPAGSTLRVPAGTYVGLTLIDKPLALVADGAVTLDGGGDGDVVRITAPDVTLRGVRIVGSGASLDRQNAGVLVAAPRARIEDNTLDDVLLGIVLSNAPQTVICGNRIHGKPLDLGRRGDGIRVWSSPQARIERNVIRGVRDVVVWYSQGVELLDNTVTDSRYGTHFMYAGDSVLEGNRLAGNSVGAFLMYSRNVALRHNVLERNRGPSGYGLGLKDVDGLVVEENHVLSNRVGVYIDSSPSRADIIHHFQRNTFAYNDVALAALPAVQHNEFRDNTFLENIEQVAILGSGELRNNRFTVDGRGNYWSDYAGFDADGDGVGDAPYRALSLFESLMDREPRMRLFIYSPAQQAIDLAARAFPIMQPAPKITDDAPLMRPVVVRLNAAVATGGVAAGRLGATLLLLALLVGAGAHVRTAGRRSRRPGSTSRTPNMTEHTSAALVQVCGLSKRFGRTTVVHRLDLSVQRGTAVALWGENGAGKTTILKCMLGLHRYQGEIRIGGLDARRDGKATRRLLGYVSQELSLYDDLTARETLRLFAALKRVPAARGAEVLAQVGLAEHVGKRVGELSGGMKQRLALAVALLADPPLLLLDEPTSNLDAAARRQFLELLVGLRRAGKTIVFTTHRVEEAVRLADRVIVLKAGRVERDGPPAAIDQRCRLRIVLSPESREAAFDLLARSGFSPTRNCSALFVSVAPTRKAAPLTLLAQSGFEFEDVDFEN
ncbi:MAG: nitrous oxide reductase family maturation protein NosD [Phycisphaerae bacterium]|jgi:nitrous oxidase accessory protein